MTGRCEAELFCLLGIGLKHGKRYCWPGQEKLLDLLKRYNGVDICRRTLNRDFRLLEDDGWFKRQRRTRRDGCGKRVYTSTLFRFGPKLFKWLEKMRKRVVRVFSLFRVPNMSHYQATQKPGISLPGPFSVEIGSLSKKVGPIIGQIPETGS
jgi:hypothetical protein